MYISFIAVRAYSEEIFSKHKTLKKSIDEDCMMWFLNPHVKKLTLPAPFHSERVIQQLKVIGSVGIVYSNEKVFCICVLGGGIFRECNEPTRYNAQSNYYKSATGIYCYSLFVSLIRKLL